jgi:hypothetical protein
VDGICGALAASIAFEEKGVKVTWLPMTVYSTMESRVEKCKQIGKEDTLYLIDYSGFALTLRERGGRGGGEGSLLVYREMT